MLSLMALAAVTHAGTPQASAAPDAAKLISAMFQRYSSAKTISGRIRLVQEAMTDSFEVDTDLGLERPDMIYLDQHDTKGTNPPAQLVSDGVRFVYTAQVGTRNDRMRMMESLNPAPKKHLHIPDIYPCVFSTLIDHSAILDVAVARTLDLRMFTQHMDQFALKGTADVLGRAAYDIGGAWKNDPNKPDSGTFDLYLSNEGDLLRLQLHERFAVSAAWLRKNHLAPTSYQDGVQVTSTWDADLKVDQPLDHQLFVIKQGQ